MALIALIAFAISRCVGSEGDTSTGGRNGTSQSVSDRPTDQTSAGVVLTSASMQRIPDDDGVFTFSLGLSTDAPALEDAHRAAIVDAYDALTEYGATAGFLFIDLQSGKGIGCNIDEPIYAASAVKGLYACYLAEAQVDAGLASWTDEFSEGMASGYMDENGEYLNDDVYEYALETLVEDSVVHSDNDAYRLLRVVFDGDEYVEWLNSAGVDGDDWRFTDWWTNYSAREAAALWLHMRDYIAGDSPAASRLQGWLRATDVSMIRNALAPALGSGFTLMGKAGWNADMEQVQFNALGDAGIVSYDGKDYLIVVLSTYPGEDDTFFLAEDLITALWNARDALAA